MKTDSDRAAASIETCFRSFVSGMADDIWRREEAGVLAFISGLAIPLLNSVSVYDPGADLGHVHDMLTTVLESGFPCLLQGRAALQGELAALAAQFGLVPGEALPLMILDDVQAWAASQPPARPRVRELTLEERHLHAELLAAGFAAPLGLMVQMVELFHSGPNSRMYVAEVAGVPVSTSVSVLTEPDSVGIFDVATPPEHRRHGYGAAATAHAIRTGLASGATWAWLQSSPAAYSMYERMGFRTVEKWPAWTQPTTQ